MSDIKNFDIQTQIIDAIMDAFDTMVSMEIEFFDSEPPDSSGSGRMVASVNLAGNILGTINIQVDAELSRLMMASKLDIEAEEVKNDFEIKDLLAEISNIVGDDLKSALNATGHHCVASTPSITYGADFTIKSLNMERFERFVFKHREKYIIVEVGLKAQQTSDDGEGLKSADALAQISSADIAKINALDINARVSEAIIDVFDTKLSLKLEPADAATVESLEGIRNVGSVSLAGDATGMVSIHAGNRFSREMAAKMLGMEVEAIEGDEEIKDMLGEMGSIVGENLKSAFSDAGLVCDLSTPSFTSGTDFTIEALNMENYERFAFRCDENIIFVEMGVKVSEATASEPDVSEQIDITAKAEENRVTERSNRSYQQNRNNHRFQQLKTLHRLPRIYPSPEDVDLDILLDIPLEIKVELGRARIKIRKLLNLTPGSAVKLIKLENEPVDILINEILIAKGEVIVQNEKYGIRVTEITSRMDRIRSFSI